MVKGRAAAILTFLTGISLRRPGDNIAARRARRWRSCMRRAADFALSRAQCLSLAGWQGTGGASAPRAEAVQEAWAR